MTKKKSKIQLLLQLLSDGEYHYAISLMLKVGHRFGHYIYQARKLGYNIETKRVSNHTFCYRWIKKKYSRKDFREMYWRKIKENDVT